MKEAPNTELFSAYKVKVQNQPDIHNGLHAYLVESNAPDNIDEIDHCDNNIKYKGQYKDILTQLKVDGDGGFIEEIANTLDNSKNPTLIISVHGFNNPPEVILPGFWKSFECVHADDKVNNKDVVCIGYRWPSEAILAPRRTIFKSAPNFLKLLFYFGIILLSILIITLILTWYEHSTGAIEHETTILVGIADPLAALAVTLSFVSIPVTLFLLRLSVYFRDGYRATSFGIPDLVEIIRQIDKKLDERHNRHWLSRIGGQRNRVQLSFIGHSMGCYVVTSVVRILSDVFDPATMREGLNKSHAPAEEEDDKEKFSKIGHVFKLAQLILVSPDIPAEALITSRANFLSNSLKKFEEKYLFSNEGDEVLRQIATVANYFSFPTKNNKFGYRLGNVCLPGKLWGISKGVEWSDLTIGDMTISEICAELGIRRPSDLKHDLPAQISYFDCTDCVDNLEKCGERGILTLASRGHPMKNTGYNHLLLLLRYLLPPESCLRVDVHGGYFRSPFLSKLIYRLACLGYEKTKEAYGGETQMNEECSKHQVKALLALNPKVNGTVNS